MFKFSPPEIYQLFASEGGIFCCESDDMCIIFDKVRTLIFDWDGVFNDGQKSSGGESSFSEIDSMGINLLRYALYFKNGIMPCTVILTGMKNPSATYFAQREHFDYCFLGFKNKDIAFQYLLDQLKLQAEQCAFWFDDVLDLPIARQVGLRLMIPQKSNLLFKRFVQENKLADYISSRQGGQGAIRETCEMLLGISGHFIQALNSRANYDAYYDSYFTKRQSIQTLFFQSGPDAKPLQVYV